MMPTENPPVERDATLLSAEHTRIEVASPHHRTRKAVTISDGMDFWSFAGAAANVVMQLSRREVGYGVVESKVESGALTEHPWKRARTTAQYLAVAILGTDEERNAYRQAVNGAHRHVRSGPNSPVQYNAFDPELQLWVAACLFIGFEDTYQLLHGKMSGEQAEAFYRSSSTLGTTLQVTEEMWPATREDFACYWNAACEKVGMDDTVRSYLQDLVNLRMIPWIIRAPFANLLRFLTIGFLAPLFREQLGVEWSEDDRRRFEHLFVFVSFVNRFLPRFVRHGGAYLLLRDLRWRIRRKKPLV